MIAARLAKLRRIGAQGRALLVEAGIAIAATRIDLALRSFAGATRRRGVFVASGAADTRDEPASETDLLAAQRVGWAVRAIAPWMPVRSLCLQQALAAQAMLRRRGVRSDVQFGVGRAGGGVFEAHAWLRLGAVEVTGFPLPSGLTPIGTLAGHPAGTRG